MEFKSFEIAVAVAIYVVGKTQMHAVFHRVQKVRSYNAYLYFYIVHVPGEEVIELIGRPKKLLLLQFLFLFFFGLQLVCCCSFVIYKELTGSFEYMLLLQFLFFFSVIYKELT